MNKNRTELQQKQHGKKNERNTRKEMGKLRRPGGGKGRGLWGFLEVGGKDAGWNSGFLASFSLFRGVPFQNPQLNFLSTLEWIKSNFCPPKSHQKKRLLPLLNEGSSLKTWKSSNFAWNSWKLNFQSKNLLNLDSIQEFDQFWDNWKNFSP